MRLILTDDDLAEGAAHLAAVEPRFARALDVPAWSLLMPPQEGHPPQALSR